jgi:hypothetical protein
MTYRSKYTGRYTGMASMLRQPWMIRAVTTPAHKGLEIARNLSPVGKPGEDPHPGAYRSAWKVTYGLKNKPFRGRAALRQVATLVNDSDHARHVEYGNGGTPEYRVARNTVDALKAAHGL